MSAATSPARLCPSSRCRNKDSVPNSDSTPIAPMEYSSWLSSFRTWRTQTPRTQMAMLPKRSHRRPNQSSPPRSSSSFPLQSNSHLRPSFPSCWTEPAHLRRYPTARTAHAAALRRRRSQRTLFRLQSVASPARGSPEEEFCSLDHSRCAELPKLCVPARPKVTLFLRLAVAACIQLCYVQPSHVTD